MKGPAKEAREGPISREAVHEVFDFDEMAQRSLAATGTSAAAKEKDEFTRPFLGPSGALVHQQDRGYSDEKVSYDFGERGRRVRRRQDQVHNQAKGRDRVDYKDDARGQGLARLRVVVERVKPGEQLPHPVQQDNNHLPSYAELVKKDENKKESELPCCAGQQLKFYCPDITRNLTTWRPGQGGWAAETAAGAFG